MANIQSSPLSLISVSLPEYSGQEQVWNSCYAIYLKISKPGKKNQCIEKHGFGPMDINFLHLLTCN